MQEANVQLAVHVMQRMCMLSEWGKGMPTCVKGPTDILSSEHNVIIL